MDEFELIKKYFSPLEKLDNSTIVRNGDDAAVISVPERKSIALSVDTLVEGIHFLPDTKPEVIGFRSAAVNLSDMAAMGAQPCYGLLSLVIPDNDEAWLRNFSLGLGECLDEYNCSLIGGDTARGPLVISLTMVGHVSGPPLTRAGAKIGDTILVSGTLGDASGALGILNKTPLDAEEKFLVERYERPLARISLSINLLGIANSAIDISDGLLADAGHIAAASDVGIDLLANSIPISSSLSSIYTEKEALEFALSGGDDYELMYTVPQDALVEAYAMAATEGIKLTKIGMVTEGSHVRCLSGENEDIILKTKGYKHF